MNDEEITLIKDLCSRPTDSNENIILRNFHTKIFGFVMDMYCGGDCMRANKARIMAHVEHVEATNKLIASINSKNNQNGKVESKSGNK